MNRKLHIEMLRIIAVVMVVLNHSDLYYTYYTNTDSVLTFCSVSCFFCADVWPAVLCMESGYIFSNGICGEAAEK